MLVVKDNDNSRYYEVEIKTPTNEDVKRFIDTLTQMSFNDENHRDRVVELCNYEIINILNIAPGISLNILDVKEF